VQHTTTASEAPCRRCGRLLLHAWDEGLIVRADASALAPQVAAALRDMGRRVFARTRGGYLVYEPAERLGSLRMVVSRHAEHLCRGSVPAARTRTARQLTLFDQRGI
jgi:hypothetical protein